MLTIAHALSLERPKRSVLVMFHAGEELGLLGSEYNTDYAPVVPLDKMVADLNIDMIGRSKPAGDKELEDEHLTDANTVYLVGSNRISQELHQISEETNCAIPENEAGLLLQRSQQPGADLFPLRSLELRQARCAHHFLF